LDIEKEKSEPFGPRNCPVLKSFCLTAISSEGEGGCSSRLKIYWAEAQGYFLICPFLRSTVHADMCLLYTSCLSCPFFDEELAAPYHGFLGTVSDE
jgi:hypothetical protein